jgi:hypothetical protein
MKTKIKQANWKSKSFFGDDYMNIVTTIFWQSDKAFIETDSKLLFQIICENFFTQYKETEFNIKLKQGLGYYYPELYQIYVYNKIYKKLTGKKIKDDISKVNEYDEEFFYRVKLETFSKTHQKRVLKIIEILNIDFKKESDRLHRVLFDTKKKKKLYISDKASISL